MLCGITPELAPEPAQAGVVVDGTRVVYPANKREISVNLHNVGDAPSLVQVWIDAGNDQSRPGDGTGQSGVPFALTPPLFRIDPAKGQTLRVAYTQDPLLTDRETVYWLNVLDIPPRAAVNPDAPNHLEMAFRHRLKLFFRPTGLPGNPADAAAAVVWTIASHDGTAMLTARNPTAYNVSFTSATVAAGDGLREATRTAMLPPFSSVDFPLAPTRARLTGRATVHYSFVNDYGAVVSGDTAVGAAVGAAVGPGS